MTKAILFAAALTCASAIAQAQVGGLRGGVVGSESQSGQMSNFGSTGTFGSDSRSVNGDAPAAQTVDGRLAPATARPAPAAPNTGNDTTAPAARPPVEGSRWGEPPTTSPGERPRQ